MDSDRQQMVREIITAHVKRKQILPDKASWQACPELPAAEEILRSTPTLYPNIDEPQNKAQYLEKQYKMFRHEGIEPLRQAIQSYLRSRGKGEDRSSFVYSNARVRGYTFSKQGAACRIAFSTATSETVVNWHDAEQNRLKVGSLVALSKDNFKSQCLIAVVAARPLYGGLVPDMTKGENDWTPPRIDIFWARTEDAVWDPAEEMVMIEARSAYYEPQRYAMLGLQHAALQESRFDKYLVSGHKDDPHKENYDAEAEYHRPEGADSFDESQEAAWLSMMLKELAIVQGPPGTGKTFTSIVALESLAPGQPSPIIISAHTNHALDQLLRECMTTGMVVARLGGRTQDEDIEQRTIYNIALESKFGRGRNFLWERKRVEKIRYIEAALTQCFPDRDLISAKTFVDYGIITQDQFDSLFELEWEVAENLNPDGRRTPDGVELGAERAFHQAQQDLLLRWMAEKIEKDKSHEYKPPENKPEPCHVGPPGDDVLSDAIISEGSDLDAQGPTRKAHTAPEERDRKLDGQFLPLFIGMTSKVQGKQGAKWWRNKAQRLLEENDDLYEIQEDQRGPVYRYLRQQLVERIAETTLRRRLQEYKAICEDIRVEKECKDVQLIKKENIRVIGCTTTGLTKYRGFLSALQPRVLLVEEAAETHEPNISAALVPSLEQLILVGDHQQLAPKINVREMRAYGLEVSLFERLVGLKVPFTQLRVQRRMAPPIRQVVQAFYSELSDHEVVHTERPAVQGIASDHRIWWFQHRWPDSRYQTSSINLEEARMIIRLYQYLFQNGLKINEVTILSFYKAQVEMIKSMLSKDRYFGRFRAQQVIERRGRKKNNEPSGPNAADWDSVVRTVDGFQGEQNEVIILSAVRSCSSSGFVAVENRAVVALSRAKRGMYVFGNEETLLGDGPGRDTWGKVWNVFVKQAMKGASFPITCVKHERVTEIHDPETWTQCEYGGCDLPCEESHCGNPDHPCTLMCHPPTRSVACQNRCEKKLSCGHSCSRICGKPCQCDEGCGEPAIKDKKNFPQGQVKAKARPDRSQWTPSLAVSGSPNKNPFPEAQNQPETEIEPPSTFRQKYCALDEEEPQLTSSHPVLMPVIHETFRRTAVNEDGSRFVTETTHEQHRELLIDFSTMNDEPQLGPGPAEKEAEDEGGPQETKADWLIEL